MLNSNKRLIPLALVGLIFLALTIWLLKWMGENKTATSTQNQTVGATISSDTANQRLTTTAAPQTASTTRLTVHANNGAKATNPQTMQIGQVVSFDTVKDKLWQPLTQAEAKERAFVTYDTQAMYAKKIGDKVNFQADVFNINRTGIIRNIETVDSDITRWSGTFESGDSAQNRFRITQSKKDNYALAMIYTDQGVYELESKNGVGWIRPSQFVESDSTHEHESADTH